MSGSPFGAGESPRAPEASPAGPLRPMPRRRRRGQIIGWLLLALLVAVLVTPTGCYLGRAGWEEAKILAARRPIENLVDNPTVSAATRAKLELVLATRRFAQDSIGLDAGRSFTTFTQLRKDTLVLVVSAAYRDRLMPYSWWFPIVGRVPYKGFFDFDAARRLARELDEQGFDAYVRPASAFSTLGWFNDPLLSTTLRHDSLTLANTVIHELTHSSFYASGHAVFNESFANFVGARGAEWLFRARGDSALVAAAEADWTDEKLLGRFWTRLYAVLDSAFQAHPEDRRARLAARDSIYSAARRELVHQIAPQLRTIPTATIARARLDNASLLARRLYMSDLELFDRVYLLEGSDLRRAVTRVIALARSQPKDPFRAVREWVELSPTVGAPKPVTTPASHPVTPARSPLPEPPAKQRS